MTDAGREEKGSANAPGSTKPALTRLFTPGSFYARAWCLIVALSVASTGQAGQTGPSPAVESAGGSEAVQNLLTDPIRPQAAIWNGVTTLMAASEAGKVEVIQECLRQGADVNRADRYGRTALMLAAANGHADVLQALLSADADLNLRESVYGRTALHAAALSNKNHALEMLLEAGADVNAVDTDKETPLMVAAGSGNKKAVELLLNRGADLTVKEKNGIDALFFAVLGGHVDVVRLLLEKGADPTERYPHHLKEIDDFARILGYSRPVGSTTLMWATQHPERAELVDVLIDHGADPNARGRSNETPLFWAVTKPNNRRVISALLDRGAAVKARGFWDNFTAQELAALMGNHENAQFFHEYMKSHRERLRQLGRQLIVASYSHDQTMVRKLLEQGADVSVTDKRHGATPLHWAAYVGDIRIVRQLVKAESDINVANNQGQTPLMAAAALGNSKVVEYLFLNSANVDAKDNEGRSAGDWAEQKGFHRIAGLLRSLKSKSDLPTEYPWDVRRVDDF